MPMKINYDRMCNVSYGSWLDSGQKMVTRGGCWLCPFQWLGERMIMKKQKKGSDHKDINITTRWLEGLFNKDITINDEVYSVQSVGIRIMLHI
ncbi:hypothetical protein CIPAW_07G148700 [Carya illinoinensis]|uniref:Uncharacterized protein n=1 Tax=Carya illinoinensis TaxID=32201 RepID=A0A8T1Q5K7_CARIL|nr:hypothetical protein CIPAW_07G148700 [Carya illinoinensis]